MKIGQLILICLALVYSMAFGDQIINQQSQVSGVEFSVVQTDRNLTVVDIRFPEAMVSDTLIDGNSFDLLWMKGMGHMSRVGYPQLPQTTRLLAIDATGEFQVEVSDIQYLEYDGLNVLPAQPPLMRDGVKAEFQFEEEWYRTDVWYPEKTVRPEDAAVWREIRVLPLNISPFQYNPARKQLRFMTGMRITIRKTGPTGINELPDGSGTLSHSFDPLYRNFILNYTEFLGEFSPEIDGLPDMLVITHDQYYSAVQPFAQWKTEKGVETVVYRTSEIGTNPTATQIKAFISAYYQAATDKPDYLLIVGDVTGAYAVPWFAVSGSMSDHPYYQLVGNDILPDISGGRISVQTLTEATNVFTKLINYEKTPFVTDPDWFHSSLVINSNDFQDPTAGFWANAQFTSYGYSPVYHLGDNLGNATVANVSSAVNSGVSYIYYIGHGAPLSWSTTGFSTTNVRNLTNGARQPVISSVACNNADLDVASDVFAEVWLKYSDNNGSVGIMAFTESCAVYDTDTLARGMVRALLSDTVTAFGNIIDYGRLHMFQNFGLSSSASMHQSLLVGEPELQVWTRTPDTLMSSLPGVAFFGTPIPVQVNGPQGPLEGALVCYWDSLGNYERGYTDQTGAITLNPGVNQPVNGLITITAHNANPVQSTINILPPNGPYVLVNNLIPIDTLGNANQVIEAGEHFFFQLQLENIGVDPAGNVSVRVSSADTLITFLNDSSGFGTLVPSTVITSGNFEAQVSIYSAHRHLIPLNVEISADGGNLWQQNYWIEVRKGAEISLSSDTLTFPETYLNSTAELQVTCQNLGPDTLWISDITSDIPQFFSFAQQYQIPPGGSELLTVGFMPDSVLGYGGTLTIHNSDPLKYEHHIFASGTGRYAPDIEIGDSLQVPANPTDSLTRTLTVQNLGLGDLTFSAQVTGYRPGQTNIEGSGGADAFGHIWVDSDETSGPVFDWIDISGSGNLISLTGNNAVSDPVPIGFDFSFYGIDYQNFRICSNGWVSFSTVSVAYNNLELPSNLAPRSLLAPLWDDLLLAPDSRVYTENLGNKLVVMFQDAYRVTGEGPYTFEVILYDNGNMIFQYLSLDSLVSDYTVGIQNHNADDGLTIAYNENYLKDSLAVLISKHSWLTVEPTSGQLGANGSMDLKLTIQTENFPLGDFYAAIQIESNDPDESVVLFPVHLFVGLTGLEDLSAGQIPTRLDLAQNYPNPFNPSTTIKYNLPGDMQIELSVYNLLGQKVRTLISDYRPAGYHSVAWDGKNDRGVTVSTGIYIYQLRTEKQTLVRKMIMMK